MARRAALAQADDLIVRQRGVAAVDVADDVGVGRQHHVRVDQPGARDRRAAGVDGAADAVLARPRHHLLRLVGFLDAAEADLAQQRDAGRGQFGEVALDHALLEHRRAGQHLDAARAEAGEGALRGDRQRLDADDVLRPAGQVHLARRDHRRHAAVEAAVDPAELVLPRRPVAEHRVHVAVDQARRDGGAARIDDDVGALGIEVLRAADGGDACRLRRRCVSASRIGRARSPDSSRPMLRTTSFFRAGWDVRGSAMAFVPPQVRSGLSPLPALRASIARPAATVLSVTHVARNLCSRAMGLRNRGRGTMLSHRIMPRARSGSIQQTRNSTPTLHLSDGSYRVRSSCCITIWFEGERAVVCFDGRYARIRQSNFFGEYI